MTRVEAFILAVVAAALLVVSAVWVFGPFGMAGAGVVLLVVALFAPTREG